MNRREDILREEVLDSIDIVESVLRLEAPGEALGVLCLEARFAGATLLFPAGDAPRLRALLRQLSHWRDGRKRLPGGRSAAALAAAIVSLDPDAATWSRSNIRWTGVMERVLAARDSGALALENEPVRVQVRGADTVAAALRIEWILRQLGVPR